MDAIYNESYEENDTFSTALDCSYIMEINFISAKIGMIIILLGILGNITSAIVLVQPAMRNSTSILLVVMAVYDFSLLILSFLLSTVPSLLAENEDYYNYAIAEVIFFKYLYGVLHAAHTGTIYMTVLVTIERAVIVVFPLQARHVCSMSRAGFASLIVLIWSVIYSAPRFLEYSSETEQDLNDTDVSIGISKFGSSHFYNVVYLIYINSIFHFILPITIIVILNTAIIQRLYTRGRNNILQVNLRGDSQLRLTAIIIAITIIFCGSQILALLELALYPEPPSDQEGEKQYLNKCALNRAVLSTVSLIITLLNSAINFIIYSIFGRKFRQCIRELCCCCFCCRVTPSPRLSIISM